MKNDSIAWLYDAVRLKLGDKYKNVYYQMQKEDEENNVGIYLYSGQNDVRSIDGNDVYNCIKVHVQVNCERSLNGLVDGLDYLSSFVDRIENETCELANILFVDAVHIGPKAVPIGRNKYDIQVVKCDIDLKYVYNV